MIFNFQNEVDCIKANERLKWLISKKKRTEIKELRNKRSTPQNAYLHLLLSYWALEYGETLSFTKTEVFKDIVNRDIFLTTRKNPKNNKTRNDWRSSADLNTKEMTNAIDKFKNWSVTKTGIRLPEANEDQFLDHIQNEIDKNKQYL